MRGSWVRFPPSSPRLGSTPVAMHATPPEPPFLRSFEITSLHDHCTRVWHVEAPAVPSSLAGFERVVAEQHLANFELGHAEDAARSPGATDQDIAGVKRLIDSVNQRRNDLTEQCDRLLLDFLNRQKLPADG